MKTLKGLLAFENRLPNGAVAPLDSWKGPSLRTHGLSASPLLLKTKSGETLWYLVEYVDRAYWTGQNKEPLVLLVVDVNNYSLWTKAISPSQSVTLREAIFDLSALLRLASKAMGGDSSIYIRQALEYATRLNRNLLTSSPVFLALTGSLSEIKYYMNMAVAYSSKGGSSFTRDIFSQLDKLEQILSELSGSRTYHVLRLPPRATLEYVEREELLEFFKSARYER